MARKTICTDLKAFNMQGRDTACDTYCETDPRMVRAPVFNKVTNPASPQFTIAPTTARIRGTSYRFFSVHCFTGVPSNDRNLERRACREGSNDNWGALGCF